jgi:Tat protein translocase TatC
MMEHTNPEHEMSLVGHLSELRNRLIVCLIALVLTTAGAFFVAEPVLRTITLPIQGLEREPGREEELTLVVQPDGTLKVDNPDLLLDPGQLAQQRLVIKRPADPARNRPQASFEFGQKKAQQFYYRRPLDPFMMHLNVALIVGVMLALPICLWQIWAFIRPGLRPHEARVVRPLLAGALLLFPLGAGFAFFIITLILKFMQTYAVENIGFLPDIFAYLHLLTMMMIVFGIIFELPLAVAIAARIGLVTPEMLRTYRRHAYVALAFAAMILTPADPFSMMAAFVPLIVLYEISVVVARPMALLHSQSTQDEPIEEEPA